MFIALISLWFNRSLQSDLQLAHIARQIHPLKVHGPTAVKCDRRCTRDLVSARRYRRATRRYWYLRDEARVPFSRTMSVRLARSVWRSRRKPREGRRKAHCYFHGSSLILPAPSWDMPPTGTTKRVSSPSWCRAHARSLARCQWWKWKEDISSSSSVLHRFASVRWACNTTGVNITIERKTLNIQFIISFLDLCMRNDIS